jgi:hypothetical protein
MQRCQGRVAWTAARDRSGLDAAGSKAAMRRAAGGFFCWRESRCFPSVYKRFQIVFKFE